jgi:hypothetical protein
MESRRGTRLEARLKVRAQKVDLEFFGRVKAQPEKRRMSIRRVGMPSPNGDGIESGDDDDVDTVDDDVGAQCCNLSPNEALDADETTATNLPLQPKQAPISALRHGSSYAHHNESTQSETDALKIGVSYHRKPEANAAEDSYSPYGLNVFDPKLIISRRYFWHNWRNSSTHIGCLIVATVQSLLPMLYRIAEDSSADFASFVLGGVNARWYTVCISIGYIIFAFPLIYGVALVCQLSFAKAKHVRDVHSKLSKMTDPVECHDLEDEGMPFLDLRLWKNIDFWVLMRKNAKAYAKDAAFTQASVTVASAILLLAACLIIVFVRIYINGAQIWELLNVLLLFDAALTSCFLIAFIGVIVHANTISQEDHLNILQRARYFFAKRVSDLRRMYGQNQRLFYQAQGKAMDAVRREIDDLSAADEYEKSARNDGLSQRQINARVAVVRSKMAQLSRQAAGNVHTPTDNIDAASGASTQAVVRALQRDLNMFDSTRIHNIKVHQLQQAIETTTDVCLLLDSAVQNYGSNLDKPITILGLQVDKPFILKLASLIVASAATAFASFITQLRAED